MHGIAERVEDRGDLIGHVVRDRHDVVFRQAKELAEGARPVDADAERVAAQMPAAGAAVAALAADDMPSPETRSPTWYLVTAEPTSAISPMNSWPTTIGTGIVFCAHWSQFQMCTSVPQIADFLTLISTSFGPISGTGTRSIQRPSSGFDLTSAFIMFVI